MVEDGEEWRRVGEKERERGREREREREREIHVRDERELEG